MVACVLQCIDRFEKHQALGGMLLVQESYRTFTAGVCAQNAGMGAGLQGCGKSFAEVPL